MATINGREGRVVVYGTSSGVLDASTNLTGQVVGQLISYSIEESINLLDSTILSDTWTTNVDGVKSWSGSFEAFFDPDDTTGQDLLTTGSKVKFDVFPDGGQTLNGYGFRGYGRINSISRSADNSSLVKVSFSATGTGELRKDQVDNFPTVTNYSGTDTTPDITGTLTRDLSGETLYVILDGTTYSDSDPELVVTSTSWTLTPTSALSVGTYTATAVVEHDTYKDREYGTGTVTIT